MIKELWAFTDNRIAVRFAYEWHDDDAFNRRLQEFLLEQERATVNPAP